MIVWLLQYPYQAFASAHIHNVPHKVTTKSSFPQVVPFIKCESRVILGLYFDLANILVQPILMMSIIVFAMKEMEFLFYFPSFWALISQPFQPLHCILLSLMFSCTQLCTVTEFMLLSFPTLCNFIVDYVLLFIVCHCICNRLCPDFTSLIFTLIFPTGIHNGMECKALHFTVCHICNKRVLIHALK